MSINATDNKFGLPKPDFQALPKKKAIWPLLLILGAVALLIAIKLGYTFYFKKMPPLTPSSETIMNGPVAEKNTPTSSSPSSEETSPKEGGESPNGKAHPSISHGEKFEGKQNNKKIKKSISATQKQLVAKQNKPLVSPGTYQELKEPQGIYHLVVVSYLDKQSAMRDVKQLVKNKLGVYLILPRIHKGEKYYRVTIGHSKTQDEAERKLEKFKPNYKNTFILQY